MKKLLLAASAAGLFASAAQSASFDVNLVVTNPLDPNYVAPLAIPGNNDFNGELGLLGMTHELLNSAITINGPAWIDFFFMGSESGNDSSFSYDGVLLATESSNFTAWQNVFIGSAYTSGGAFLGQFSSNNSPPALPAPSPSLGFAVFVGTGVTSLSGVTTIYFGYDDIPGTDDNHDDMIIKAVIRAVPEPSTWALMVAGIAAVGVSMRRRSQGVRVAFS